MRTLTAPTLSAILAVTIVTLTGNCLLAQSVPAPMQLVGEGTISTDGGEIFPTFSISGDTLYFSTHEDGWSRHNIVVSHLTADGWSSPTPTSFNSSFDDRAPYVSPDGNTLIFSSNRPLPGAAGQTAGDFNLWLVVRTDSGRWLSPEPVPGVNSTANDFHAAIVSSGAVYFSSDRAGGLGENDIYRAEPNDDGFDAPVNLGAPVNSAGEETDLYVSPDESFLILVATEKEGGFGGDDLWLSRAVGGDWSELTNLGQPVNSTEYEYGPMMSRDGRFLLLSTHRRGKGDIVRIAISDVPAFAN